MNTTHLSLIDDLRELLTASVHDVLATAFQLEVQATPQAELCAGDAALVVGAVGFIGDVNGMVYIFLRPRFADQLARRMLQLGEAEPAADELVNDVVGELSNMVVGAVKSQLCDRGMSCVLTIPAVMRGRGLATQPSHRVERRSLGFVHGPELLQVEIQLRTTG